MNKDSTIKGGVGLLPVTYGKSGQALRAETPSTFKPDLRKKSRSGILFSSGKITDRRKAKEGEKVKSRLLINRKTSLEYVLVFDAPISTDNKILRGFSTFSILKAYQSNGVILSRYKFIQRVATLLGCSQQTLYRDFKELEALGLIIKDSPNRYRLISWKIAGEIAAKIGGYKVKYLSKSRHALNSKEVRDEVFTAYRLATVKENYKKQRFNVIAKAAEYVDAEMSNQNINARFPVKYYKSKSKDRSGKIRRGYIENELDNRVERMMEDAIASNSPKIGRERIAKLSGRKSATSGTNLIRKAIRYNMVKDYIVVGETFCFTDDVEQSMKHRYTYMSLCSDRGGLGRGIIMYNGAFHYRECNQIVFNDSYSLCKNKSYSTELHSRLN